MTLKIKRQSVSHGLTRRVEEISGISLNKCYQCKKCSIGCPVAERVASAPSEIIRRMQLGAGDEILQTDLVWTCLSCDTCFARCPNEINFAAVVDALRTIAMEKGVAKAEGNPALFNREFLNSVKSHGRSYDLRMIAMYKMKSGNLMADTEKFPTMLKKGKMAILPPTGADKATVRRIFDNLKGTKR